MVHPLAMATTTSIRMTTEAARLLRHDPGRRWVDAHCASMGNCGIESPADLLRPHQFTNIRDTDTCSYLSYSDAADFADLSTEVMLTVNTLTTTFGSWDTIAYSTNTKAIDAFDTSSGTWHNGATFDNWTFKTACTPFYNTGWPNMYHACGYGNGVHWLAVHRSMDHNGYKSEISGRGCGSPTDTLHPAYDS